MPYLRSKEKTIPSSLDAIQKILQKTVAPCISDIRERLTGVEGEIRRLDDKIDSVRGELKAKIQHGEDNLTTALEIRREEVRSLRAQGKPPLLS